MRVRGGRRFGYRKPVTPGGGTQTPREDKLVGSSCGSGFSMPPMKPTEGCAGTLIEHLPTVALLPAMRSISAPVPGPAHGQAHGPARGYAALPPSRACARALGALCIQLRNR
jgi:hypothetical protein